MMLDAGDTSAYGIVVLTAVCTKSPASAQSPVSSHAVRSSARRRASTNCANPSASALTAPPVNSTRYQYLGTAKGSSSADTKTRRVSHARKNPALTPGQRRSGALIFDAGRYGSAHQCHAHRTGNLRYASWR
jgi:hypothetical protein